MPAEPKQRKPLDHSLGRLEQALARSRADETVELPATSSALVDARATASFARPIGVGLLALLATGLLVMAAFEGRAFLIPAVFTLLGVVGLLARRPSTISARIRNSSTPRVGMGATVAADAILHGSSVVEMGATIGAAAVLERGVVVRMGATIGPRALLEAGATVSWGATVGEGAVVGAGAVVAAGSDVVAGARVPPRTSMAPGTTWTPAMSGTQQLSPARSKDELEMAADPRAEQIRKICDRLEEEYARAPELVRGMFGDARTTLSSLRRTCLDLLARERALRAEASPAALTRLEQEKSTLQSRLAQVSDEQVRRSLSGAVAAISAQQEQRRSLQNNADRLEAELTRLIWTMEGMGTELLRVRTAGADLYQGSAGEIAQSVQQLQDEINSIAEALEELQR